jgi:hypothetical protein
MHENSCDKLRFRLHRNPQRLAAVARHRVEAGVGAFETGAVGGRLVMEREPVVPDRFEGLIDGRDVAAVLEDGVGLFRHGPRNQRHGAVSHVVKILVVEAFVVLRIETALNRRGQFSSGADSYDTQILHHLRIQFAHDVGARNTNRRPIAGP